MCLCPIYFLVPLHPPSVPAHTPNKTSLKGKKIKLNKNVKKL